MLRSASSTKSARAIYWERVSHLLIFLWVVIITIDSIPNLPLNLNIITRWSNNIIICFFVVEYIVRIIVAKSKRKYLLSPMGLIDFMVCLPFFGLLFGGAFEMLNILRVTRILAIFQLARYRKNLDNIQKAFSSVKVELAFFASVFVCLLYVTAVGIFYAEHTAQPEKFASIPDGLWFAVVSLTTTGYGDLCPITPLGRLFTGFILVIAFVAIATSTGILTASFTRLWHDEKLKALSLEQEGALAASLKNTEVSKLTTKASLSSTSEGLTNKQ